MRHSLLLWFVFVCLLILTGCVSPQELTTPSETLEDVNSKLEGRKATLVFMDRSAVKRATSVEVGPEFVSYRTWNDRRERRPTSELSQITMSTGGGGGLVGLVVGALPGILIAKNPGECSPGTPDATCDLFKSITQKLGIVLAIAGSVSGALIGSATGKTYVIYFGLVERYLDP